jgi:hypothetical protein
MYFGLMLTFALVSCSKSMSAQLSPGHYQSDVTVEDINDGWEEEGKNVEDSNDLFIYEDEMPTINT